MPCCIAIIQFADCEHKIIHKLGCTAGCNGICELKQQEEMLVTHFMWCCEECHLVRWQERSIERKLELKHLLLATEEKQAMLGNENVRMAKEALKMRRDWDNGRKEEAEKEIAKEIQVAQHWTFRYGEMLWQYYYRRPEDPAVLIRRTSLMLARKTRDVVVLRDVSWSAERLRRTAINALARIEAASSVLRENHQRYHSRL